MKERSRKKKTEKAEIFIISLIVAMAGALGVLASIMAFAGADLSMWNKEILGGSFILLTLVFMGMLLIPKNHTYCEI